MGDLYLTNSLTRKKEKFVPLKPPNVSMYTCGITAYDYTHIGHGRKYVGDDILKRALTLNGFSVKHVQNVTDVGHLTSDADEGEDKLEKGAEKTGKTVWDVAKFFTDHFYTSMDKLNVLRPDVVAKATDHIEDQIDLVKKLIEKGYAYDTPEAVYFDIAKFEDYGKIFGQNLEEKKVAVREEVKKGKDKKNPADFALWFKRVGRFKDHTMHWESPWGDGFPGWHVECSAMSMKYLGEQFDIHTAGEDHLSIHSPNEIAQSEAATGKKPFVKYWLHHAFLMIEGKKMSKSLGNLYKIEDLEEKKIDPLALRYLFLTAHYKDPLNFTWESLDASEKALTNLSKLVLTNRDDKRRSALNPEKEEKINAFREKFINEINDDLNTPKALATMWEMLKSNIPSEDKYDLALFFDEVFGLNLAKVKETKTDIPNIAKEMMKKREDLRKEGKFKEADEIREKLKQEFDINLEDTKTTS